MSKQINYDASLKSYYEYIMDYLDAKYDHHSVPPAYMSEDRILEMTIAEAQARYQAQVSSGNSEPLKGTPENPYTPSEWRALHK